MFRLSTLSLTVLLLGLTLAQHAPALFPRQSYVPCVEQVNRKPCGSDVLCIPTTWTCCQKQQGGCSPGNACFLDDNGDDCCCPVGRTCSGVCGAVTFVDATTRVSTIVEQTTVPVPTSVTVTSAEAFSSVILGTTSTASSPPALSSTSSTEHSPLLTSTGNVTTPTSTRPSPSMFTGGAVGVGFAHSELLAAALLAGMQWVL
ncbi:hypothetical protein H2201_005435 [Coniosporium apollinis]|uniref:GPI anchored serine-threonine rich protein n=2 Tax=Coniosporium TaxID=2810619 RepID=A0ABQ9NQ54_9PEZI|nr:hypothetical protein H2199_004665 [Cladosporium sp. JES 115]KAJ9663953.1 hypothetical protein H2201_005435 [Coniosporium apollinis]